MSIGIGEYGMTQWFIPGKDHFQVERAVLHLGLNAALRYYRELVVPGIGGVWFVRHLSWPAAGIMLAQSTGFRYTASRVANGIEALACKFMWKNGMVDGIRGMRAFNRNPGPMSFRELSQAKYYVQVTFRQSAVRALAGLELTDGGNRFNSMCLSRMGEDLANAFFDDCRVWTALEGWIDGKDFPQSGKTFSWFARLEGSGEENRIVRDRLLSDTTDNLSSASRRRKLIEAVGNRSRSNPLDLSIVKGRLDAQQRYEVETAESFDGMLTAARELVHQSAEYLEDVSLTTTGRLASRVSSGIRALKSAAHNYMKKVARSGAEHVDAGYFADAVAQGRSGEAVLGEVLSRDGAIIACANKQNVTKGPLFSRHKSLEAVNTGSSANDEELGLSAGPEETSTANKINQLFSLWRDCKNAK
jgi:hypothetical protein